MDNTKGFAIYRLPGERDFKYIEGKVITIESMLDAPSGFLISKYDRGDFPHSFVILPEKTSRNTTARHFNLPKFHYNSLSHPDISKEDYIRKIEETQLKLNRNFRKVVLSRTHKVEKICSENAIQHLETLAASYERSFVYLVSTKETGTWSGASPELLISQEEDMAHTMALAGTIALDESNEQEIVWSEKEYEEQRLVELFIEHNCKLHNIPFSKKGPLTTITGKLAHLLTRYSLELETNHLARFVRDIHPTPAVCGLPKQVAQTTIAEVENHDRSLYTGFLGEWQLNSSSQLFVNLRCMQYNAKHAVIYAGGGITAASNPDKEWYETCNKINSVKGVLTAID